MEMTMNDTLASKTGPTVNRHHSKQDFETPDPFLRAVESRFGPISWDLAADSENYKGPDGCYYDLQDDSLKQIWSGIGGLLFLNPPFSVLEPWVEKCKLESMNGADILALLPASVGSNWFAEHVDKRAFVYFLRPRLVFVGHSDPYPRDLMLCRFNLLKSGYECWRWNA